METCPPAKRIMLKARRHLAASRNRNMYGHHSRSNTNETANLHSGSHWILQPETEKKHIAAKLGDAHSTSWQLTLLLVCNLPSNWTIFDRHVLTFMRGWRPTTTFTVLRTFNMFFPSPVISTQALVLTLVPPILLMDNILQQQTWCPSTTVLWPSQVL